MSVVIKTENLIKDYGKSRVVDNINLNVNQGEIYGVIGKNGAGKTTTLKMISGLCNKTSGRIEILGQNIESSNKVLRKCGVLIENPGLFYELNAYDNMKLKCIRLGIKDYSIINDILKLMELDDTGKKICKNFSLGMKQRLGIALALVGKPQLLILDEPINGLDPQGIASIRNIITKLNKERNMTIMLSSHVLVEMTKVVTSLGFIDKGRLIESMPIEELHQKCEKSIYLSVDNIKKTKEIMAKMNILKYKIDVNSRIVIEDKVDDTRELVKNLVDNKIGVYDIYKKEMSLEDFYFSIIGEKYEK